MASSPAADLLPVPWLPEDLDREERFAAALESRGLGDVLLQHYRRELARAGQPLGRRNWLRAALILLLEHRADGAGSEARKAFLAEAAAEEARFTTENLPPGRDDTYFVVQAHLARVRGEREAERAAGDPEAKALVESARARLRAAVDAVAKFRAGAGGAGAGSNPSTSALYLRLRADLEAGLALVALAGTSAGDDETRNRSLLEAREALERVLMGAPVVTRLGVQAALARAAAMRERGDTEQVLADLKLLTDADTPQGYRRRILYELALALLRDGQLEEALAAVRSALGLDEPETGALVLRLEVLEVALYLRLASQTGNAATLSRGLAAARALAARRDAARPEVLNLLAVWHARHPDLAGDDPLVQFAHGDLLFRQKKYAEAVAALEAVLRLSESPERTALLPEVYFTLGAAAFRTQSFARSAECFERLAAEFPTGATAAESAHNATVARENAYRLSRAKEDLAAYVAALRRYLGGYPAHGQTGLARWRLAEALLREVRDFPAAAKAFGEIPPSDPEYWLALLMVAESHEGHLAALLEAGAAKRAQAREAAGRAVPALDRFVAHVLDAKAWPDEKVRLRARSEAAQARVRAAQILLSPAGDQFNQAVLTLAAFETEFPDQAALVPRVEALRLQALVLADRHEEAGRQLERILKASPADLDTLRALKGAEERTKETLSAAETDEQKVQVHLRLARVYDCFLTWLAAQPGDYRTYLSDYRLKRAEHLAHAGRYEEALPLLEAVEKENPKLGNVVEALAAAYEHAGQFDRALERYRRLVEGRKAGSPEWFEAELGVARVHLKRGKPEEGLRLIRLLREAWPDLGGREMQGRFAALERDLNAAGR